MTRTCSLGVVLLWVLAGCEAPPPHERVPQLKLPKGLEEISGLTMTPGGELLAVADERADIYRIRFDQAEVTLHSRFGGKKSVKGDFEGIALLGDTLYIVTSEGDLLAKPVNADDGAFEQFDTALKKTCELEGLATYPGHPRLLLLCKTPYIKGFRKSLLIYAWSAETQALQPDPWLALRYADHGLPRLHPSGISFTASGNAVIVAGREQYHLVLTPQGEVLEHGKLPNPHVHLQTEGVVLGSDDTLYLADEGQNGRGTITRYDRFF